MSCSIIGQDSTDRPTPPLRSGFEQWRTLPHGFVGPWNGVQQMQAVELIHVSDQPSKTKAVVGQFFAITEIAQRRRARLTFGADAKLDQIAVILRLKLKLPVFRSLTSSSSSGSRGSWLKWLHCLGSSIAFSRQSLTCELRTCIRQSSTVFRRHPLWPCKRAFS